MIRKWIAYLVCAIVLVGCSALPTPTGKGYPGPLNPYPAPQTTIGTAYPAPDVPTAGSVGEATGVPARGLVITPGPGEAAAAAAAMDRLAKLYSLSPDQVRLQSIEVVEWPDSSLGCPQTGKSYLQIVVPGYRMTLEAGGEIYEVHTDQAGKQVVVCGGPVSGERVKLGRNVSQADIVAAARQHLAGVLRVAERQIELIQVETVSFDDPTLGCQVPQTAGNQPDQAFQGPVEGLRITLGYQGKVYEYHQAGPVLVSCGETGQ